MNRNALLLIFAGVCLLVSSGCKNWFTLEYQVDNRPIQMGPHQSAAEVDTLGLIGGFTEHESVEDTYSESDNVSITFSGGDYYESDIDSTIYQSLRDNPNHFIADGEFLVEVEYGVTFGAFLASVVAGWFTDEESTAGSFTRKRITQYGIVYRYKKGSEQP